MSETNTTETAQSTNNAVAEKSQADVLFGEPAAKAAEATNTQTTTQTVETKAAEPAKTEEAAKPAVQAEIKVGDLKIPKDSMLDQGRVEKIAAYAKANNLSNEQAQGLVDMAHETLAAHQESVQQQLADKRIEWADAALADKELGGPDFAKNVEIAKRGMEAVASPALKKMLDDTGFGNHPEVIKLFHKIGQQSANGQFHQSGAASNTNKKSAADILFG